MTLSASKNCATWDVVGARCWELLLAVSSSRQMKFCCPSSFFLPNLC